MRNASSNLAHVLHQGDCFVQYNQRGRAYMGCLLSINANLALVKVWDQHSIALSIGQMLSLSLDLICDSPPLLCNTGLTNKTSHGERLLGSVPAERSRLVLY